MNTRPLPWETKANKISVECNEISVYRKGKRARLAKSLKRNLQSQNTKCGEKQERGVPKEGHVCPQGNKNKHNKQRQRTYKRRVYYKGAHRPKSKTEGEGTTVREGTETDQGWKGEGWGPGWKSRKGPRQVGPRRRCRAG